MSTEEHKETIKEAVREVFLNPAVAERVVDAIVKDKPAGWGRRSVAPYYKEVFGKEVKAALDGIELDKQDRIWPLRKFNVNLDSLYLRVNQGLHYLLDRMDTSDKKYFRFSQMVSFKKEKNLGVRVSVLPDFREDGTALDFTPIAVQPKHQEPVWQQQITDYLETATEQSQPLHINNLALTPDQIRELKISFAGIKGIMHHVTAQAVKIIKVRQQ